MKARIGGILFKVGMVCLEASYLLLPKTTKKDGHGGR